MTTTALENLLKKRLRTWTSYMKTTSKPALYDCYKVSKSGGRHWVLQKNNEKSYIQVFLLH